MKRTARLIVTEACPRSCSYCCNKQPAGITTAKRCRLGEFSAKGFDEIVITGGEPMLFPERVKKIIDHCNLPTYLYTAFYNESCWDMMRQGYFAGLSYTLHEKFSETDHSRFQWLQADLVMFLKMYSNNFSARLKIHPSIPNDVIVNKALWKRVDRRPFVDNCPLPENEELFILTE